jgi:hypothetical protein
VYGSKIKLSLVLALFILIMEENIYFMNLKATYANMGSRIKPQFHTILNYNSVVKRMNMTLLNMVHSMMFFKNVKLIFWDVVVQCV